MTEFLHHLATFGADHVCSSVFPFLDRILQVARLSILLAEQEKNFSYLAQILGPTLAWERSADAPDWLDGSRAWVLTEVALLRIYNMCMQQPASQAILRRSARSIPMFRADAPTIHLKNRRTFTLFTKYYINGSAACLRMILRHPESSIQNILFKPINLAFVVVHALH